MSAMSPVICALILLGFFTLIARPMLTRQPRPAAHAVAHALLELQHQKELVYAAIKELELDRAVGKVDGADYAEQRRSLEDTAVALLNQLEHTDPLSDRAAIEGQIEQDIAVLIEERDAGSGAKADSESCSGCGARGSADYRFCPQCGTEFGA